MPQSLTGTALAILAFSASATPSLLPRIWQLQAAVSAICVLFGYALGAVGMKALRFVMVQMLRPQIKLWPRWARSWWWRLGHRGPRLAWAKLGRASQIAVFSLIAAIFLWGQVSNFQTGQLSSTLTHSRFVSIWAYLGGQLIGLVAAIVLAWLLIWLWRGCRFAVGWLIGPTPSWTGAVVKVIAFTCALFFIGYGVLFQGSMIGLQRYFQALDQKTPAGIHQPKSPFHSGSSQSGQSWQSIGAQGQQFVARGARALQISKIMGGPAQEPIRAYASPQGRTLSQTADVVVSQLRQLGAFDREYLLVATATSTGWVDDWAVQSLEYLAHGDCASAAMQYSVMPSAAAYWVEGERSAEAAQILLGRIQAALVALPPSAHRPKLLLTGTSMGALASQDAYMGQMSSAQLVQGAVWAGTPVESALREQLLENRDIWSPEAAPVLTRQRHVRFYPDLLSIYRDQAQQSPGSGVRLVFLNHPSDGVAWWNPRVLWQRPDWLTEPAVGDRNPFMRWYPFVTAWQLSADMAVSGATAPGHGHTYHQEFLPSWRLVLGVQADRAQDERIAQSIRANLRGKQY